MNKRTYAHKWCLSPLNPVLQLLCLLGTRAVDLNESSFYHKQFRCDSWLVEKHRSVHICGAGMVYLSLERDNVATLYCKCEMKSVLFICWVLLFNRAFIYASLVMAD